MNELGLQVDARLRNESNGPMHMSDVRYIFVLIFLVLCGSLAHASGDYGCYKASGTIFIHTLDTCSSAPFLSPSNDSRINLELLLIDAGKLKGSLTPLDKDMQQFYESWLPVPFNMDRWQLVDLSLNKPGQTSDATEAKDYAQGEGNRHNSEIVGNEAFKQAVSAAKLPAEEASILIASRTAMAPTPDTDWQAPAGIHSALGREFAMYIAGASAFYEGKFPVAVKLFRSLSNSANPWLKEASSYMIGRTLLNDSMQTAFDQWGSLDTSKVDKAGLKDTEDAFKAYLHAYPTGTYAASARGLMRRVYWLGGDHGRLAEAIEKALFASDSSANNVTVMELVQEADLKLLSSMKSDQIDQIKSPRLLAIFDLMLMRSGSDGAGPTDEKPTLTLEKLEAQKSLFASEPALYTYLLAVFHVYVDNKPAQALALLPSQPDAHMSYFSFSQQTLRVLAMEASTQFEQERKLLLQLFPLAKLPLQSEQLQLSLARLEERTGHVDRAFAAQSPIRDENIRMILAEYAASPELLRQIIKDPKEKPIVVNAALYALLYKELTSGKYQEFQSDLALMPSHPAATVATFAAAGKSNGTGYSCPSMREVAATLQQNGNDAKSLNCIGEYVRINKVHYGQEAAPPGAELGGAKSSFPVTKYSRMASYLKVIADTHADSDARAYAFARAVRCYEPAGSNACGEQDIPQATRKQWFQTLHQQYPDSPWAKSLKYYW